MVGGTLSALNSLAWRMIAALGKKLRLCKQMQERDLGGYRNVHRLSDVSLQSGADSVYH